MHRLILTLFALTLLPSLARAQDELSLFPDQDTVAAGTRFELLLSATFTSAVLGGEVHVDFDPSVLHLDGIEWNDEFGDDPLLRCRPEPDTVGARGCEGRSDFVAFGHEDGLSSGKVGTLQFVAIGAGTTHVELVPASPFADLVGGSVSVTTSESAITVVPEPGFAVALGTSALALGALTRRPRRA